MNPDPSTVLLQWSWVPRTWVDVVQIASWCLLCVALVPFSSGAREVLDDRATRRRFLCIVLMALATRLIVPFAPVNWYSGVTNVDLGGWIFSKRTAYMPLPNQLMMFTLGFYGIVAFNIALGAVSAVLAWYVALISRYGSRVAFFLGLAVAVTPLYVRLSASDSTHLIALPLWLLAALAVQRLVFGSGGRVDQIVLFASAVVACPVRLEAGLVMPSALLFVARDLGGLRKVWRERRRWYPFVFGLVLGLACSVAFQHESWQFRLAKFDPLLFVFQMTMRALFLVNPEPFGWVPITFVLLVWYYVWHTYRRRDFGEVAATVAPFVIFSVPYAYALSGIAVDLPASAYGTTINMFLLLGASKGADLLGTRLAGGF